MHMGALATIGQSEVANFKHILINNGCHDSVGGQPTAGLSDTFDFLGIAKSCGYKTVCLNLKVCWIIAIKIIILVASVVEGPIDCIHTTLNLILVSSSGH